MNAAMNAAVWPSPWPAAGTWPPWARWLTELRVDVHLPEDRVQAELDALNQRRDRLLGAAEALPPLAGMSAHLRVWVRQADGEFFVYVMDPYAGQMVAYVTLNRLVELNRQADRLFRAPHTKVAVPWRRRGIASAIYRWWLDSGQSLMTGARQSPAARGLWLSMARHYRMRYVSIDKRQVLDLGDHAPEGTLERLGTRAVLLGRGRELADGVGGPRWVSPAPV